VTLIFGWGAAMAIACFGDTRRPARPRRRRMPASAPVPAVYDPGPLRGTPFEALARYRYLASQGSGGAPPER
jgi:hypothetical protein